VAQLFSLGVNAIMELSAFEKRVVARTLRPDSSLGTFASIVLKGWMVVSLLLACYIAAPYLLLVWFYGFWRVHKEGLYFTYEPSSHDIDDYLVSNGDHITKTDGFISFPMAVVVWAVLILAGYLVIKYFSRRRKEAVYKKALEDIYDA
jgi:hypothetical protein